VFVSLLKNGRLFIFKYEKKSIFFAHFFLKKYNIFAINFNSIIFVEYK